MKIYVFDGNNGEVTRVYNLDKYVYDDSYIYEAGKEEFLPILIEGNEFLYKLHTKGMSDEEKKQYDSFASYYNEPQTFININEDEEALTSTSLMYYENGIPKSIEYKNGMIFSQNCEITKKLVDIVNEYEHQNQEVIHRPTNVEFENSVSEEMLVSGFNSTILGELTSEQNRDVEDEVEK